MKRFILATLYIFLLVNYLHVGAQDKWSLTVETALQQTYFQWPERIASNQSIDLQKQIGFSFGTSLSYQFSKQWSVHTGMYWTERGGRMEESSVSKQQHSQRIISTITTNYLELPLGISYNFPVRGFWQLKIRLNMLNAIGISGFEEISTDVANDHNNSSESQQFRYIEYGNNYRRMSQLLSIELGLTRILPKQKGISLWLRYQHGFNNLVLSPESGITQLTDLRHRAIGVVLAYQFGLGQ